MTAAGDRPRTRLTYDRVVERWIPAAEYHQNRYARALDRLVRPGCRWLDLGAGTRLHGGWTGPTQDELCARAAELVGCDPVGEHLARNPYLTEAVTCSGERMPFADGRFDLVSANMVLEHLPDPLPVFREVRRVLAGGGSFVVVTPNVQHPAVRLVSLVLKPGQRSRLASAADRRQPEHVFPTCYRANTVARLKALAAEAGFRTSRVAPFSSFPMFRRPLAMTWLECGFIRFTLTRRGRRFRSNLLGVFTA